MVRGLILFLEEGLLDLIPEGMVLDLILEGMVLGLILILEGMVLDPILILEEMVQEEQALEEMVLVSMEVELVLMALVLANWVLDELLNSTDQEKDLKLDLGHLLAPSSC